MPVFASNAQIGILSGKITIKPVKASNIKISAAIALSQSPPPTVRSDYFERWISIELTSLVVPESRLFTSSVPSSMLFTVTSGTNFLVRI